MDLNEICTNDREQLEILLRKDVKVQECSIDNKGNIVELFIINANLKEFYFPELEKLFLFSDNTIDLSFIEKHINLTHLTLRNNLRDFPEISSRKLTYLNLDNNLLEEINSTYFFPKLKTLIISRNNIKSLDSLFNLYLCKNLRHLILSHNYIQDLLDLRPFKGFTKLETLDLSYNKIKTINISSQIQNLKSIDLSNNLIQEIHRINNLPKLRKLYLNNNNIKELKNFGILKSLEFIDTFNNPIKNISDLEELRNIKDIGPIFLGNFNKKDVEILFRYIHDIGLITDLGDDWGDYTLDYDQSIRIIGPFPKKIFKINDKITLKLIDGKTKLFIDNKEFIHCKFILITVPKEDMMRFDSIDSIAENFGSDQLQKGYITPEEEFWGHCSNLQLWAENDYDTRYLHINLAFPLLERLSELRDKTAIVKFKEEIVSRYNSGDIKVRKYIENGKYLEYLSVEEKSRLDSYGNRS
ncbi:MAG: leucine-rich repeat domain-containing protein [Candidatus Lokiarchaeota archaeon]|nr:leucine-rich repeat domain-containing protein [Candidatus Lokiarchaeota archaeon]